MRISLLSFLFFLIQAVNIFAPFSSFPQKIPHRIDKFEPLDGLPSKTATSAFKDSRGFMWFGTESGLFRYDGYNFREFRNDPGDSTSISGNFISNILFEDKEGNLWIGTQANGLNIFNPNTESFTHFLREPDYVFDLTFNHMGSGLQDEDGKAWLKGDNTSGLIHFDAETGNYEIYRAAPDSIACYSNRISCLYRDQSGRLWVGTFKGLFFFDKNSGTFTNIQSVVDVPDELNRYPIINIIEDTANIFWIGTNSGLYKYDEGINKMIRYRHDEEDVHSLCSDYFQRIYNNPLDGGKTIWVITRIGINKFDKATGLVTRYVNNPEDPLCQSFDNIYNLYLEDNGILWAATDYAGITRYNLNDIPFSAYRLGPYGKDNFPYEATTFCKDEEGFFWVGTYSAGLLKYDKNMRLIKRYGSNPEEENSLSYPFVFTLYRDTGNIIWIGSNINLDALDVQKEQIHHCTLPSEINYAFIRANDIYRDSFGVLWLATTGGLYYLESQIAGNFLFKKVAEIAGNLMETRCLAEDHRGNIWIGSTSKGIFLLTPEDRDSLHFINYRNIRSDDHSLSDDIVFSICVDCEGKVWCGTPNGLNRFDFQNETFVRFNEDNGLIANFIYDIEGDKSGNLWLSTEKGLVCFTMVNDSTGHSKLLEKEDDLPFSDNYQYKIFKLGDGKIYVGGRRYTGDGYYCFDPDSLQENNHIPPIVMTSLLIKNKPADFDTSITEMKHLHLKYFQNYFTLGFAALDFINPLKNNYAYYLEGFDEGWIFSGNRHLVSYTNVPPGEYIFHVKGSNNDDAWNETGASLHISVGSPPWKTWWAYLLYLAFLLLVFFSILRFYLNRQKLIHNLELKHVEAEKLEELNREKSKFFANISHEFRTPLTLIIGPVKKAISEIKDSTLKVDLKMTLRNALRLQNLINQLLSLSKIESGEMKLHTRQENIVSLVRGYFQSFESAARHKNIVLIFHARPDDIPLYVDRDKMEKILYNLFSNAIKFTSEGGRIEVTVSGQQSAVSGHKDQVENQMTADRRLSTADLPENTACISVSDTGPGIAPDHLPHIFDRFYQADNSMTRDQEGTGIGLALVKELVELHHGRISVTSDAGSGTTFIIRLPLGAEHLKPEEIDEESNESLALINEYPEEEFIEAVSIGEPEEKTKADKMADSLHKEKKPVLLIVEDNVDMRSYLRNCLVNEYAILEAGDGEKGVAVALERIPDLVISDVMMPKMDGYQLCRKLKDDERTSHIPIILLTARANLESKIEGLEFGADDFISKPFDALELQVRVKNLVEQRKRLTEKFMRDASQVGLSKILEYPATGMISMEESFLKKSVEIVRENIADPNFGVEAFSDRMALSRSQLYRKLNALTSLSPNEFIRYTRLQRAAEMISLHTDNIAGIAYDVGFNNPSYFAECFKKQFGVLPSDYPTE